MTEERSPARVLNEAIDGLSQAIGAASQMIHHHSEPRFLAIRDALELTKEGMTHLATMAVTKTRIIKAVH